MRTLICLLLTTFACGSSTLGECPTDSVAAQAAGKMVMTQSCATCHSSMTTGAGRAGAPGDVNFDTAAGVQADLDSAWSQVESGAMPPSGKLQAAQLEQVRVYLACGATN